MVDDIEGFGALVCFGSCVVCIFAQLAGAYSGAGKFIGYEKGVEEEEEADADNEEENGEKADGQLLQKINRCVQTVLKEYC